MEVENWTTVKQRAVTKRRGMSRFGWYDSASILDTLGWIGTKPTWEHEEELEQYVRKGGAIIIGKSSLEYGRGGECEVQEVPCSTWKNCTYSSSCAKDWGNKCGKRILLF